MEADVRESVQLMVERALAFRAGSDPFAAYMYLWTAFNNIYRMLHPEEGDHAAWKAVLTRHAAAIDSLQADDVTVALERLRANRPPESPQERGVLDMREYLRGQEVQALPLGERPSLPEIGSVLYAVRNNLVHAVKREVEQNDREVLEAAFTVLLPIVQFLEDTEWLPAEAVG